MSALEATTGRRLGGTERPLVLSVRSGGGVSMPGMMNTILNLGLTAEATAALAAETGDRRFALDSRLRFLQGFASAVHGLHLDRPHPESLHAEGLHPEGVHAEGLHAEGVHAEGVHAEGLHPDGLHPEGLRPEGPHPEGLRPEGLHPEGLHLESLHPEGLHLESLHLESLHLESPHLESPHEGGLKAEGDEVRLQEEVRSAEALIRKRTGSPIPDEAMRQLELAVQAVFESWHTPRAKTYRELHGISHELGTAVTVQAMVFGNRDGRSGSGVAFSRDPNTGEPAPYGEVLFTRQGDDVVSGRTTTRPLHELAVREPKAWAALLQALQRTEEHYRDVCHVEFTFETGRLWLLQVRPGGLAGRAAVRVAVDLAEEGAIGRKEAVLRISPRHLQQARTPRIAPTDLIDILTRGLGACPGVAYGKVATSADSAARMAATGPVILVRPETSPLDMHGLAAAAGVVTASGGPTSHAAVVARAMGKPAVVGAADLVVDTTSVRVGARTVQEGTLITIDGTSGDVVLGNPGVATPATDSHLRRLLEWAGEMATGKDDAERLPAAGDDPEKAT